MSVPALLSASQCFNLWADLARKAWEFFGADTLMLIEMERGMPHALPETLLDARVWIGDRADEEERFWSQTETNFVVIRDRLRKDLMGRGDNSVCIKLRLRSVQPPALERFLGVTLLGACRRRVEVVR